MQICKPFYLLHARSTDYLTNSKIFTAQYE